MRCRAHNQQTSNGCDGENQDPVRDIKCPFLVRAKRFKKSLLLNKPETPHCEFNIGGTAPNGGDDGECNVALDVAAVRHGVVEHNRHDACIEDHQRDITCELPSLETVAKGERELREQLRVVIIV